MAREAMMQNIKTRATRSAVFPCLLALELKLIPALRLALAMMLALALAELELGLAWKFEVEVEVEAPRGE